MVRSKKRSRTDGAPGAEDAGQSSEGPARRRAASGGAGRRGRSPRTRPTTTSSRTLAGRKWQVLKGYHVLRHSFISCLAAEGVDQRIIDEFVGHSTEEQRRRYRHLVPDVKQQAIAGVFG